LCASNFAHMWKIASSMGLQSFFFWKNFWIGFVSSWPCSFQYYPPVPSIHLLSSIAPVPNP
jgi:hypothetical protein